MSSLYLICANIFRSKTGAAITIASIASAFALYGVLCALGAYFDGVARFGDDNRLFILPKGQAHLTESQSEKIRRVPGVMSDGVTFAYSLRGYYQDPKHTFQQAAIDVDSFIAINHASARFVFDPGQLESWLKDRRGVMVNISVAEEFGWKVGDRITIIAPNPPRADGSTTWEFNVSGIFHYRDEAERVRQLFFHYEYLDESRLNDRGSVQYLATLSKPGFDPLAVSRAIDGLFVNSGSETNTGNEDSLGKQYYARVGNIALVAHIIVAIVLVLILLAIGSSYADGVLARSREIGTLKAIGYSSTRILRLVTSEAILLSVGAGSLGLLIAYSVVHSLSSSEQLRDLHFARAQIGLGILLMLAFGLLIAFLPVLRLRRMQIPDALRHSPQ